MKRKNLRANATEINKAPQEPRFVFLVVFPSGKISAVTTYRTLRDNLSLSPFAILCADIRGNQLWKVAVGTAHLLMEEWRENYHDPDWSLPEKYIL